MPIERVWIVEGCISCSLCEDLCPEVFQVPAGALSRVRKGYQKHLGDPEIEEQVQEAIDSCPVEVIKGESG